MDSIIADGTVRTYARISEDAYKNGVHSAVPDFARVNVQTSDIIHANGFYGACYIARQGQTGVVAFRGTEPSDISDLSADASLAFQKIPVEQLGCAFALFNKARLLWKGHDIRVIVVTGHSLGGALAQVVAARVTTFPVIGVTFNAPGSIDLSGAVNFLFADQLGFENFKGNIDLPDPNGQNIYNFRSNHDPVSWVKGNHGPVNSLKSTHIGRTPVSIPVHPASLDLTFSDIAKPLSGATRNIKKQVLHYHSITPLAKALESSKIGAERLSWSPQ